MTSSVFLRYFLRNSRFILQRWYEVHSYDKIPEGPKKGVAAAAPLKGRNGSVPAGHIRYIYTKKVSHMSPTYILNEDAHPVIRATGKSHSLQRRVSTKSLISQPECIFIFITYIRIYRSAVSSAVRVVHTQPCTSLRDTSGRAFLHIHSSSTLSGPTFILIIV